MGGEGVTNQEMNTYTAIPIQLLSLFSLKSKTAKIKGFSGTFCFDLPLSGG